MGVPKREWQAVRKGGKKRRTVEKELGSSEVLCCSKVGGASSDTWVC